MALASALSLLTLCALLSAAGGAYVNETLRPEPATGYLLWEPPCEKTFASVYMGLKRAFECGKDCLLPPTVPTKGAKPENYRVTDR